MGSITRSGDLLEMRFRLTEGSLSDVRILPDREFVNGRDPHWTVPSSPWHARLAIHVMEKHGLDVDDDVRELVRFHELKPKVKLLRGMRQHQKEAVRFIEKTGGRALVGDDPGTGKTISALGWCYHTQPKRVLVVSPTNVLYKWRDEVQKWLKREVHVVPTTKGVMPDSDFVLMTYDMVRRRAVEVRAVRWDLLILDEIHKIKNRKAQRTKVIGEIAPKSDSVIGLTGHPFLNRHLEMFRPLHIVNPTAFPDWYRYAIRYTLGREYMWTGLANEKELIERVSYTMIRRTKREVLPFLPDLTRVPMPVDLPRELMQEYEDTEVEILRARNGAAAFARLRVVLARAKREVTLEWALDFLDGTDEKLVIYVHHIDTATYLENTLGEAGYSTDKIIGSVPAEKRYEKGKRFQNGPNPRVMIISEAAKEGMDLYRASHIWFAERELVPGMEEQAEGRLHRDGQKSAVTAWYPMVMGTVDEHIDQIVNEKRIEFGKVLKTDAIEMRVMELVLEAIRRRRGS